jgi:hypothetical protein
MLQDLMNMEGVAVLSKQQQSGVVGGNNASLIPAGTCQWQGGGGYIGVAGVDRATAEAWSSAYGGHWCCDSCGSASWSLKQK